MHRPAERTPIQRGTQSQRDDQTQRSADDDDRAGHPHADAERAPELGATELGDPVIERETAGQQAGQSDAVESGVDQAREDGQHADAEE
jgi:hypothetical protein